MSAEIKKSLFDLDGFFVASEGSDSVVPNLGKAGSALDATNNGLVRVEGGAIWSPGPNGAGVSSAGNVAVADVPVCTFNDVTVTVRVNWVNNTSGDEINLRPWVGCFGGSIATRAWMVGQFGQTAQSSIRLYWGDGVTPYFKSMAFDEPDGVYWFQFDFDPLAGDIRGRWAADQDSVPSSWTELPPTTGAPIPEYQAVGTPTVIGALYESGNFAAEDVTLKYASVARLGGDVEFVFDGDADIDDPAATSITTTSGDQFVVTRGASGPTLTLVPAGKTVYVNPDNLNLTIDAESPNDPTWDIDLTDDALLVFCGTFGNATATFDYLMNTNANLQWEGIQLLTKTEDRQLYARLEGNQGGPVANSGYTPDYDPLTQYVISMIVDRSDNTFRMIVFDAAGVWWESGRIDASSVPAITATNGLRVMNGLPGTVSSWLWNKGVGIAPSDESIAEIANYLLKIEGNLFLEDELDPNFDLKNNFLQPKTPRARAAYRSPIDSEQLNLFYNSTVNDINKLYTEYDLIQEDISVKMQQMYEDGPGELKYQDRVESIYYYADQLATIRSQIENLR